MSTAGRRTPAVGEGLDALRHVVLTALGGLGTEPGLAGVPHPTHRVRRSPHVLAATATDPARQEAAGDRPAGGAGGGAAPDDTEDAFSTEERPEERERLIGLVELARGGDKEAFGLLYDHYHGAVYRFLYYRTRSVPLAEDLTSETFFRALRRMGDFRWQGRDFGAWLMTIARNLTTDHFKAGRTRLEHTVEDMGVHDDGHDDGPESTVLSALTNEILMEALGRLPSEQQDCLVMRFLQGMSIAETAAALERTEGAVKQLQLRGVRNLAKLMPEGIRES
ncbi:sigma-70 family RNA polymerase sigma factor [Nocardioides sp. ChNu-153]|uniref:sigma-70 family RNA polymerase sigma factor n=1 Tax=unclassified Nocardioides TaxID=2615069 RepID=UPI002406BD25|nr:MULTISPECIES: sigma-70 family RNA polymerase sigma factor [unclassified Nocardioides]MDF9716721.1 sigma-70 family RNA polymerase sigma factor [Nocardioides sp. ChNu-99]MDN7121933.1 sigma-70 family RNA polymerase sigma factor [Nocardioides sp. ChNu-153]